MRNNLLFKPPHSPAPGPGITAGNNICITAVTRSPNSCQHRMSLHQLQHTAPVHSWVSHEIPPCHFQLLSPSPSSPPPFFTHCPSQSGLPLPLSLSLFLPLSLSPSLSSGATLQEAAVSNNPVSVFSPVENRSSQHFTLLMVYGFRGH